MRLRAAVLPVLVCATVAVGVLSAQSSTTAAADSPSGAWNACVHAIANASGYGMIDTVVRAESADISMIAAWQEARVAALVEWESPLRSLGEGRMTVCLYRGQFVTPTGPTQAGAPNAAHDSLRVLVDATGQVTLDSAGYAGRMSPETPLDWLSSQSGDD